MRKVEVFRFKGIECKYLNGNFSNEKEDPRKIQTIINDFIANNGYSLVDIKVNTVDCRYHNNGGFNSVDLIYTVIYDTQQ